MTLTLTLKLKIAFSTLLPRSAYCSVSQSPPWFFIRQSSDGSYYGRLMSVRVSVRPTLCPSWSPSARFSHFSPICFDIMSWNFAYDFGLMYYGSSSSVVTLRQFLKELCLFMNLEYRTCEVFRTFLQHALSYWAEIVHLCSKDQVQVLYLCIRLALRPSNHCLHLPPICIGNRAGNKFDFGFFDVFPWEKEL